MCPNAAGPNSETSSFVHKKRSHLEWFASYSRMFLKISTAKGVEFVLYNITQALKTVMQQHSSDLRIRSSYEQPGSSPEVDEQ